MMHGRGRSRILIAAGLSMYGFPHIDVRCAEIRTCGAGRDRTRKGLREGWIVW